MPFKVTVKDISGSGLARTVSAEIANTGQSDAHNVWGKIQVFSGGGKVKVNATDFEKVDIGTLRQGEAVAREATVRFSLSDGLRLSRTGADVVLTVYSDDGTQTLNYAIRP